MRATADGEAREPTRRSKPRGLDLVDPSAGRPMSQPHEELVEPVPPAFGDTPQGAVRLIGDPAAEREHARPFENEISKANALHASVDARLEPRLRRLCGALTSG